MKKLFIHIGTHKTGSTAIQNALGENRFKIRDDNIALLPVSGLIARLGNASEYDSSIVCKVREHIKKHASKVNKKINSYVISSETFSGNILYAYNNTNIVANILYEATLEFDVYIIVYLRRQDQFFESLYTQMIHEGKSYSFDHFYEQLKMSAFNWLELLDAYAQYFGRDKILARRYDRKHLPDSNSLVNDFARVIGVEKLCSSESNVGYSRDALELAKLCNKSFSREKRSKLRKLLQVTNTKMPFDNYQYFNDESRKSYLSSYDESNSKVAKIYFNEASCQLFEPPKYNNEPIYKGLSLESFCVVITNALLETQKLSPNSSILILINKIDFWLLVIHIKILGLKKMMYHFSCKIRKLFH